MTGVNCIQAVLLLLANERLSLRIQIYSSRGQISPLQVVLTFENIFLPLSCMLAMLNHFFFRPVFLSFYRGLREVARV